MKRIWLLNARIGHEFTQEEVAKKVGVARTTYAMYEQGQRTPNVRTAVLIGDLLGIDWQLFFEVQLHETCKKLA